MVMSAVFDFTAPLFVPADRPERFDKAAASGADAVILDLEDAVAANAKNSARAALRAGFADCPILVRVNAIGTPWHEDDMAALAGPGFSAVIVPKAEFNEAFDALCARSPVPVIALIESARGLADARRIAATDAVVRLAFGSIDYCADLGCAHTRDALLAARSELVLASRLAGIVAPLDGVTAQLDDTRLAEDDARHAASLGFGGKLAIHPRQIAAINAGFAPSDAVIAWADRVLAAGEGAVAVDGAMVDEPVRMRARAILRESTRAIAGTHRRAASLTQFATVRPLKISAWQTMFGWDARLARRVRHVLRGIPLVARLGTTDCFVRAQAEGMPE